LAPSLAVELRTAGVKTILLTDEPQIAHHPLAEDFAEVIELDPPWAEHLAVEVEGTHFGRCFISLMDRLSTIEEPFFLWCHFGGLSKVWDAPFWFRRWYQLPGDPSPPKFVEAPRRTLDADYDPDELWGICQAYAGQVTLLDACLGAFCDFLEDLSFFRHTLLNVISAGGFPLGSRGRIGGEKDLTSESVHVPWLLRLPDAAAAALRCQALVGPTDLWATLREWQQLGPIKPSPFAASVLSLVRQESTSLHDRLCLIDNTGVRAIRTPAWYLWAAEQPQLYVKPDDQWEVNDVAPRLPHIVEGLQAALEQFVSRLLADCPDALPPLDDQLLKGLS